MNIAIIGGDRRTAYMASFLDGVDTRIRCYGTVDIEEQDVGQKQAPSLSSALEDADMIVAGIPFLAGTHIFAVREMPEMTLADIRGHLRPGQRIFAGLIPDSFVKFCEDQGVRCYDFMKYEPIAIFNAIATAEGAIAEALRHQETNIHGSKNLVLGYGRCGKVLCEKLKGLDADVTLCCRGDEALACAEAFGLDTLPLTKLRDHIHRYEYIYNTIPAMVLPQTILAHVRKDALLLELASGQGGIDGAAAEAEGIRVLRCPGLPGKYAAKTSAKCLAEFVIENRRADIDII